MWNLSKDCSFSLKEKAPPPPPSGKETLEHKLVITPLEDRLKVLVEVSTPEDTTLPYAFRVGYEGVFFLEAEETERRPSAEEVQRIGFVNCGAIVYPFLRAFVADLTMRATGQPLLLPPVNFVKLFRRKVQEKAAAAR